MPLGTAKPDRAGLLRVDPGAPGSGGYPLVQVAYAAVRTTSEPDALTDYGNFIKYDGPLTENDLPVDAHELIALCAPRPVFIGAGTLAAGDGWVDAKGMFLAEAAAGPVYKLLGKKDLGTSEFLPLETSLLDGDLAFRQHSGGHVTGPNWPTFLTFASRYLSAPPPAHSNW